MILTHFETLPSSIKKQGRRKSKVFERFVWSSLSWSGHFCWLRLKYLELGATTRWIQGRSRNAEKSLGEAPLDGCWTGTTPLDVRAGIVNSSQPPRACQTLSGFIGFQREARPARREYLLFQRSSQHTDMSHSDHLGSGDQAPDQHLSGARSAQSPSRYLISTLRSGHTSLTNFNSDKK